MHRKEAKWGPTISKLQDQVKFLEKENQLLHEENHKLKMKNASPKVRKRIHTLYLQKVILVGKNRKMRKKTFFSCEGEESQELRFPFHETFLMRRYFLGGSLRPRLGRDSQQKEGESKVLGFSF